MKRILSIALFLIVLATGHAQISMAIYGDVPYGTPGSRNLVLKLRFQNGGINYSGQTMAGYFFILKTPISCGAYTLSNLVAGAGAGSTNLIVVSSANSATSTYTMFEMNDAGVAPATWVYPNEVSLVSFRINLADGCAVDLAADGDATADALIDAHLGGGASSLVYGSDVNMGGTPSVVGYYNNLHTLPIAQNGVDVALSTSCLATVKWSSVVESEVNHYEMEYSTDGVTFKGLGNIATKGDYSNYSFTHAPAQGKAFYRIKIIDKDNKISYTNVAATTVSCGITKNTLNIYPNPAPVMSNVTVRFASVYKGNAILSVTDLTGRQVMSTKVNAIGSTSSISLRTNALTPGTYLIDLLDASGNKLAEVQKLIVQ